MENSSNLIKYVILGCLLCYGEGEEPCSGYLWDNRTIIRNGVSGQNMTLSCALQSSCVRSVWSFYYNTNLVKHLTSGSSSASDESFSVTDVIKGDMKNTRLHIDNLTESLAGIYNCNCQNYSSTSYRVSCFNVAVGLLSCQLKLKRNHETLKVTLNNN